jgi:hypothetical protein
MALGQICIDLVGAPGGCIGARKPLRGAIVTEVEDEAVVFAECRVGDCEIRVEGDGSTEMLLCELELFQLEARAIAETTKIFLVGVQILGRP